MARIVVALGGNALGNSPKEQIRLVKETAKSIVDLIEERNEVVVGHGNGPQVGTINMGMEFSNKNGGNTPEFPFPECCAMSQGYIGYHLQQSLENEIKHRRIEKDVISIVTQVIVDEEDPAFSHPTKPIGDFYSKEEASTIMEKTGYVFIEDSGRGYRRVVPSPKPSKIVEIHSIKEMVAQGNIVISVGGGGIPVVQKSDGYEGVPAVIDKDRSCALLAVEMGADQLIILTAVEKVCLNFGKPDQKELDRMTGEEAEEYIRQGQFAPGSMLPKIEACLTFVKGRKQGRALITSLDKVKAALAGETGTVIMA